MGAPTPGRRVRLTDILRRGRRSSPEGVRPADSWRGLLEDRDRSWPSRRAWILLLVAFVGAGILRWVTLFGLPFPPSSDIAEQLYESNVWFGISFPGAVSRWVIPPIYVVLYFAPLVRLLPLFDGMRFLMGLTPALLVFPAFFLLREARVSEAASIFGAAMTAFAAPWSLLLSWNGGDSLFSFLFILTFAGALVGALRTPSRSRIVLAGIAFGVVAGSDYLSFLAVVLTFAFASGLVLLVGPTRRLRARTLFWVWMVGIAAAVAFVPIYYALLANLTNVGAPTTAGSLLTAFSKSFLMSWGVPSWTSPIVGIDIALSLVALGVGVLRIRETPLAPILLALVGAGFAISLSDPQNLGRGTFYIVLALGPALGFLAHELLRSAWLRDRLHSVVGLVRGRRPTRADPPTPPVGSPRRRAWVTPTLAIVLALAFVAANGAQTYSVGESARDFYSYLTGSNVDVLTWLADHSPRTAIVYTPEAGLQPWINGYSNRQAFAPAPLNLENTKSSYSSTYQANLVALGQYVTGDPYLAVGSYTPGILASDIVYVRTSSYFYPLFSSNASGESLLIRNGGSTLDLYPGGAELLATNLTSRCPGCVSQSLTYYWPEFAVAATQTISIAGGVIGITWTPPGGWTIVSTTLQYGVPPTNPNVAQTSVPSASNVSVLNDSFSVLNAPFTVALTGDSSAPGSGWSQSTSQDGWTYAEYRGGPVVGLAFAGLAGTGNSTAFSIDTSSVLQTLGVTYILVDLGDSIPGWGYLTYLRCAIPHGLPGYQTVLVDASGDWYLFSISPT